MWGLVVRMLAVFAVWGAALAAAVAAGAAARPAELCAALGAGITLVLMGLLLPERRGTSQAGEPAQPLGSEERERASV